MGFLKEVARRVKLNAAAFSDLDLEIFKNAGSFERAVHLLLAQLDDDLQRLISKTEIAAATILDFNKKENTIQRIKDANHFACRVDRILVYRCKQYTEIADYYQVALLDPKARKNRDDKAFAYLTKMKNTLDLINKLAKAYLTTLQKHSDTKLFNHLTKLSTLDWQQVKEMLQKGDVPFR